MKKTLYFIFSFVLIMIFSISTSTSFATNSENASEEVTIKADAENYLTKEEAEILTMRIEEIREMDKSTLNAEEKLELRTELKDIKKEIKRQQGGVIYISVGTVLLVLLLVLLLR
jgi:DNA gyrase/topoisomerase IV subunit A